MYRISQSFLLGLPIIFFGCTAPSGGGGGGGGGGSTEWSDETWAEFEVLVDAYVDGNASPEFIAAVESIESDITVEDAEYIAGLLTEGHSQFIEVTAEDLAYDPVFLKLQVDLHRGLVAGGYTGPTGFGLLSDLEAAFDAATGSADLTLPKKLEDAIKSVDEKIKGAQIETLVAVGTTATWLAELLDGRQPYEKHREPTPVDSAAMFETGANPILEGEISPADNGETSFEVKRTKNEETGESTYSVDVSKLTNSIVLDEVDCLEFGVTPTARWEECDQRFTFTLEIDGENVTCPFTYRHTMQWGASGEPVKAHAQIEMRYGTGAPMECSLYGLKALADANGWTCPTCGVNSAAGAVVLGSGERLPNQPGSGVPITHRTFAEVLAAGGQ